MSEIAYRLHLQQRALARDRLFENQDLEVKSCQAQFECAKRLAALLIAGNY